jgi:hypothetical protein
MRWSTRMLPAMVLALAGVAGAAGDAAAASLRGSRAAMELQNRVAKEHELAFYRTAEDIRAAVQRGELVELRGNVDYQVADFVRYPYGHEALRLFIERLAAQYREACGQQLVVTSAVRPTSGQPSNAHALSVHPAGMAVDLRVSDRASCRAWLEDALMTLERAGVLNGIREFHPPHYHVAVFPEPYLAYATERMAEEEQQRAATEAEAAAEAALALTAAGDAGLVAGPPVAEPVAPARERRAMGAAALLLIAVLPLGTRLLWRGRRPAAAAGQPDAPGAPAEAAAPVTVIDAATWRLSGGRRS